jgi:HK97 family phage major capsid protein
MEAIRKMIEDLGRAFEAFKAENDKRLKLIEGKGFAPADLVEKVEKINSDISHITAMKKQLELIETAVARAQFGAGGSTLSVESQNRLKAFNHLMRRGTQDIKELEVQAAASTLSDPDGGFLVPDETETAIDRVAETVSAMRRLCTVRRISSSTYKKLVSQGGASSGWVAEKGSRSETDTPTLREIAINTKELYAEPAATQELLDDARIDISQWLADEVAIEFNDEEGLAFIEGDGVGEPKGLEAYPTVANSSYSWGYVGYIASGAAAAFSSADKLIDLQHALKSKYRNQAAWLMNDNTLLHIRKFKDGNGNYLWRPGLEAGASETLLGKPVEIDDNVADIGAGTYPIYWANWKRAYMVVDRYGIRVLRDPYTSKPYILFYTTKRVGGGIIMYEAIKALKVAAS